MIIDSVKHITSTYTVSIKDKFTIDMKDDCPLVSYSIANVSESNSKKSIPLSECEKLFNIDS